MKLRILKRKMRSESDYLIQYCTVRWHAWCVLQRKIYISSQEGVPFSLSSPPGKLTIPLREWTWKSGFSARRHVMACATHRHVPRLRMCRSTISPTGSLNRSCFWNLSLTHHRLYQHRSLKIFTHKTLNKNFLKVCKEKLDRLNVPSGPM